MKCPRARLVPLKKANGRDEDRFLAFTPEFVSKIYLCPPNFFLSPQLRYSGAGPAHERLQKETEK